MYVHGHVSVFVCCISSIPSTSRVTKANSLQKFSGWPMRSQAGGLEGGIGGIRRVCICPRDSGMCGLCCVFLCVAAHWQSLKFMGKAEASRGLCALIPSYYVYVIAPVQVLVFLLSCLFWNPL